MPTKLEKAKAMWEIDGKTLMNLADTIDEKQYEDVFNAILNCKGRVITLGMGTSSVAARKIAHMLCVANVPSFFASAADCAHGAFGAVQKGDLLIVLSKGGGTEELANLIESIKYKELDMIAVTQKPDSPLGNAAKYVLTIDVEESDCRHRLPTTSIITIIAIFDAIADELTHYPQFSDEIFYYNHNHGAVGATLKK